MKRYNKAISLILSIILFAIMIPGKMVQADNNLNIISETIITKEDAKRWARGKNATNTFIELADLYWEYYDKHGYVNPAIAYIQSGIETGFGNFGGVIDETYFNPCGMKNPVGGEDIDPNAHYKFNNWHEGVKAHLDHLALYAGADSYPRTNNTYDPRHFNYLYGSAKNVSSLSGKWANDSEYGDKIIRNYNEMRALSKKPSKMWIESPSNGTVIDNTFKIVGWGINDSGVQKVNVYVDGKYFSELRSGIIRYDVDSAYPGYLDGYKSGFEGIIDLSNHSSGQHHIKVEVVGKDGTSQSQEFNIERKKKKSLMWIEKPSNNSTFTKEIEISGWALDDSGISEIKAYVDNKYVGTLTSGIVREDVDNVYPGYVGGKNSGFSGKISLDKYSSGNHVIRIDAIGKDKSINSQYVNIIRNKKQSMTWIDYPTDEQSFEHTFKIVGWGINDSGVKAVKAYIDGKYIKDLGIGLIREDVNNSYPGYTTGKNSGFEGEINLRNYSDGQYTLRVDVIGNDNSIDTAYKVINKKNKEAKMWIESPANGQSVNELLNISGWAINNSGVKEIKAYIDNRYIKNLTTGLIREDVNNAYPGYINGNKSGFEGYLDLSNYSSGMHNITVKVVGNDNSIQSQVISINLVKKQSKVWIDKPLNGYNTNKDNIQLEGWALNSSGVKDINVYINDSFIGKATKGIARPDVNNAYPGYKDGYNSGFKMNIDLTKQSRGNKIIKVEVVGNDGSKNYMSTSIYLDKVNIIDLGLEFDFGVEGPLPNVPDKLVLHHAAGNATAASVHNFHRFTNGWAGIGYHFYIHKDGKIYKGREENWRGAHAAEVGASDGNLDNDTNATSLGIAVMGDYYKETMPKAQEDAVVELGKYLVSKYGMKQIFRHGDPGIGQTLCPGKNYPFERIKARILNKQIFVYKQD